MQASAKDRESCGMLNGPSSSEVEKFAVVLQVHLFYPDRYQRIVQKPASAMVWVCVSAHDMANLHICD